MQKALAVRKVSIDSVVATLAVLIALMAGLAAGYWLKGQLVSGVTTASQPTVAQQIRSSGAPLVLPDLLAGHEDSRPPAAAGSITLHEDSRPPAGPNSIPLHEDSRPPAG